MKFNSKEIKILYLKFKPKETDRNRQEHTETDRNRQEHREEQTGINRNRQDQSMNRQDYISDIGNYYNSKKFISKLRVLKAKKSYIF